MANKHLTEGDSWFFQRLTYKKSKKIYFSKRQKRSQRKSSINEDRIFIEQSAIKFWLIRTSFESITRPTDRSPQ